MSITGKYRTLYFISHRAVSYVLLEFDWLQQDTLDTLPLLMQSTEYFESSFPSEHPKTNK